MLKRILGLLGWLGVALVFAAVAIRFLKPEWQWYTNLALGGLVCTLLYMLSQWREVARSFSGREAKFGTVAVVSAIVALGILVAVNYLGVRHNKRWDLTAAQAVHALRSDAEDPGGAAEAGRDQGLRPERRVPALPRAARRVSVRLEAGVDRVHRHRSSSRRAPSNTRCRRSARWCSSTTAAPSA